MARSGPDLHPDQIRLDDEAQTDKQKVFTQRDVNLGMGGGGPGPAPDLTDYAKTEYVDAADDQLKTEVGSAAAMANSAMEKATANTKAIEEIPEGGESYDDTAIKKEISDLQGAFDTAVLAAQEGAEQLEIELQSYAKKEDLPEGADLSAYAKKTDIPTDNKDLANGAGYITAADIPDAPEIPEYKTPTLDEVCNAGYVTNKAIGVKGISTTETLDARGNHAGVEYAHFYGSDNKADLKVKDNEVTIGDHTRDAGATLNVIGNVTATEFVGDGSKLTGLPTPEIPEPTPDSRLPYRLGTDKAARTGNASIELVDAEDNYSNVKFHGQGGITCTSTIEGINVDGSDLATNESVDQKLAAQPSPTYIDWNNLPNLTT